MSRHPKLVAAGGLAAVLCLGSYSVAAATLKPAALTATQAISACADGSGYLRLASTAEKCTSGTAKVGLARSSTAPQALALYATSGSELTRTLSLIANTQLVATCHPEGNGAENGLDVVRKGQTQIDGTVYTVENGDSSVQFYRASGGESDMTLGADSFYSNDAGSFDTAAVGSGAYGTLNAHLLVTVPGAVFTIDAVLDSNGSGYCRISAEVESATTT